MTKPINLPPDAALESLRRLVNARLNGAAVNFYRIQHPDQSTETGIIFSCGGRRATVTTRAMLGDGDADEIVRNVNDWIAAIRPESKWTSDPSEAA